MPSKLSQFWQELKRRNVLRTLAVYAGTAFVILEAADILFPRWGLPDWVFNLVFYLLILGALITIVVSWIFDVTAEGIEKTKPITEIQEHDKPVVSAGWKAATIVSIVVIIGLITLNIVGGTKGLKAGDVQSLVVLPFKNFTGDEELDNMISSMHSLMIGDMGRIGSLRVISPTTSNVYKDADKSIPEIASELDVEAVMDLDVMCLGDTICLQAKVITAYPKEKIIWVAEYKEDKAQILNLYNRITKQVADEIMVELTPEEVRLLAKSRIVDREAFDTYLKGHQYLDDLSLESLNKAREYLNSAIEKDPDWAPLYCGLASVWIAKQQVGHELPSVASPKIYQYLNKALELDPDLADAHFVCAFMAWVAEWDWEKAERECLKGLTLNPSDALPRIDYAILLSILQRNDEALTQGQLALDLDPLNPLIQAMYAVLNMCVRDCKTAMAYLEKILVNDPEHANANGNITTAAYECGEYERAWKAEKHNMIPVVGKDEMNRIEEIYNNQGLIAALKEEMRHLEALTENGKLDLINMFGPVNMAYFYYQINQEDRALIWLEKGFEMHHPALPYIVTGFFNFSRLYDNPRFTEIVEKMNLPLPGI